MKTAAYLRVSTEELASVRILGRAVAFTSAVR